MKIYIYLLLLVFMTGCKQDYFNEIEFDSKVNEISLPKYPEQTIEFTTRTHIPERILKCSSCFAEGGLKTRSGTLVRDSLWANGFGITYFGVADETIIMDNMQRYIYPGSILEGQSIANAEFKPVNAPIKPINVSVSFPAKKVKGVLNNPSLSNTRQFINDIVRQEGVGKQSASLSFEIDQFTSYEELKIMFGSNKKVSGLFFNSSSGEENFEHKISKGTGVAVKFIQKYFTLDMDIPQAGLVNGDISSLVKYSPVYVSSIAYGRMGIMTIETNESYLDAYSKINEAFNTLFVKKDSYVSEAVKSLIAESVVKVYLIGANGEAGVMTINGFDSFLKVITEGGEFNQNNFGTPLYSSFSYLTDHSPYKVNFKINVDSPPVYARFEFRNSRKTRNEGYQTYDANLSDYAWTHEVYLAFYADMGAKIRTIAPSYINFNIIEEKLRQITSNYPCELPTYNYSNTNATNDLKAIEKFIGSIEYLRSYEESRSFGRVYDIDTSYFLHYLGKGRFYKGLPPLNLPDRYYITVNDKYIKYPYPSGVY